MKKNILVIGESCYDVFIYGNSNRLAPEAPVPVFCSLTKSTSLGMAGNVFTNLKAMCKHNVQLKSCPNWKQVTKTRYIDDSSNHMFIRIDENDHVFNRVDLVDIDLAKYDAIIISDYNKGFVREKDIEYITTNHPLTFLDTKKVVGEWALNATYVKLNTYESRHNVPIHLAELIHDKLISTHGPEGCFYQGERFPVDKVEIKDVAGAGDTFLAALVCEYLKDNNIRDAIIAGNHAATNVVQHRGVSVPK